MAKTFTHITEEQRRQAIAMWNDFNALLADKGMTLMYDYEGSGFYVVSSDLGRTHSNDHPDNLNEEELEQVVIEGGFGWDEAVNNPPWFTGGGETLQVK